MSKLVEGKRLQAILIERLREAEATEAALLEHLQAFHNLQLGDVIEFDKGLRMAVDKIELIETRRSWKQAADFNVIPQIVATGTIVTKAGETHALGAERRLRTPKPFVRIGTVPLARPGSRLRRTMEPL